MQTLTWQSSRASGAPRWPAALPKWMSAAKRCCARGVRRACASAAAAGGAHGTGIACPNEHVRRCARLLEPGLAAQQHGADALARRAAYLAAKRHREAAAAHHAVPAAVRGASVKGCFSVSCLRALRWSLPPRRTRLTSLISGGTSSADGNAAMDGGGGGAGSAEARTAPPKRLRGVPT